MNRSVHRLFWAVLLAATCVFLPCPARAFWGVGDTSFVTVIANPAEAANWAAQIDKLSAQLTAAAGTLQVASDLRAFAGDPRAAAAAMGDLGSVIPGVGSLTSGPQTRADLALAWQALGAAGQRSSASSLLASTGPGATMQVFGQQQARDPSLYLPQASDAAASQTLRSQIATEQASRAAIAAALTQAWAQFRVATTESGKQAILTEISQLQSQDQVLDARRRAVLDDLELSDRQGRAQALILSKAADERDLAESSLLSADLQARAQGAEAQRAATLQKAPRTPPAADYSGMKLWTTADSGGAAP